MSFNTFGKIFRFTTWGESHGPAIGCVVDGCPPNIALSEKDTALLKEFAVVIKSVNDGVMEKHRTAVKQQTKDGDHSLAIELDE